MSLLPRNFQKRTPNHASLRGIYMAPDPPKQHKHTHPCPEPPPSAAPQRTGTSGNLPTRKAQKQSHLRARAAAPS